MANSSAEEGVRSIALCCLVLAWIIGLYGGLTWTTELYHETLSQKTLKDVIKMMGISKSCAIVRIIFNEKMRF